MKMMETIKTNKPKINNPLKTKNKKKMAIKIKKLKAN